MARELTDDAREGVGDEQSSVPRMHSEPTNALRFVEREDKRILQQRWIVYINVGTFSREHYAEWRDVPLEAE